MNKIDFIFLMLLMVINFLILKNFVKLRKRFQGGEMNGFNEKENNNRFLCKYVST